MLQESSQSKARSEVTVLLQWEIKKMIPYDTSKHGFIKHPRISPPFFVLAYLDIFFKKRCIPLHKYVFVIITCAMHLWLNQKGFCFLSSLAMNKNKHPVYNLITACRCRCAWCDNCLFFVLLVAITACTDLLLQVSSAA